MKGILKKIGNEWMVQYIGHPVDIPNGYNYLANFILLHPDDIKQIEKDALVFDDIESRIRAYPHVDFKIIEGYKNYAKLIEKDAVDELANKELIDHLIDEFGEFKTTTIGADDKKYWWKKGYEKAKETLYTEEQMHKCWIVAMHKGTGFSSTITYEELIKSFKQTK